MSERKSVGQIILEVGSQLSCPACRDYPHARADHNCPVCFGVGVTGMIALRDNGYDIREVLGRSPRP